MTFVMGSDLATHTEWKHSRVDVEDADCILGYRSMPGHATVAFSVEWAGR